MTLPGLGLGLPGLSSTPTNAYTTAAPPVPKERPARTEILPPQAEWRFEVAFAQQCTVRLTKGSAELFGTELAVNRVYTFTGFKGAVFTWYGCTLEINGDTESEYVGEETAYAWEWLNVHGMLEDPHNWADEGGGARVLVVGPDHVGKSSLVRSLAAWGVRMGRTPTILNLDPREGLLAPPGSLAAVTVANQMDVEAGYGISSISGPTAIPVKTPLLYHWPYASPSEKPGTFKSLVTRMALSVTGKLESEPVCKSSGLIIDTPGSLNDPKSNYDLISHVISEFSTNLVLVMDSERLFSDLNRRFKDEMPVLKLSKSSGAVSPDQAFMQKLRKEQIKQYFFGTPPSMQLSPHSHFIGYNELAVYRARSAAGRDGSPEPPSFQPGMDDTPPPADNSNAIFERVAPSMAMLNSVIAIKFCPGNADEDTIRDSAVLGYLYVAEVQDEKKRVRFLAPDSRFPRDQALVWGSWPEVVAGLVG